MKIASEKSLADRISTHDELHQVLALLNDPEVLMSDGSAQPDEENSRQEAVSTLWLDAPTAEQADSEGDLDRWMKLPDRPERLN